MLPCNLSLVFPPYAGPKLNAMGARDVMAVQAAVITAVLVFLALYRFYRLKESKVCQQGTGIA